MVLLHLLKMERGEDGTVPNDWDVDSDEMVVDENIYSRSDGEFHYENVPEEFE